MGIGDNLAEESGKADFRDRVRTAAFVLRGHLQPITVEKDDEKVCLTMKPCGSGQRILEEGGYGPPRNLAMIEEPHPITWGMTHFPVYCAHMPVLEMLDIERRGYPRAVDFPAERVLDTRTSYGIERV